jgi:hypothetical protein
MQSVVGHDMQWTRNSTAAPKENTSTAKIVVFKTVAYGKLGVKETVAAGITIRK